MFSLKKKRKDKQQEQNLTKIKNPQQPHVMNTVVFSMAAMLDLVSPIELGFSTMVWQTQYNAI